ncbi:MAG TPA: D-lyxose/D-mannose family sugar isomerase [Armatimonadota bacterium]
MTPFTRSLINRSIAEAAAAFARFGITLPPWATWSPDDWLRKGPECDEIRDCMLGWDVTDFGSSDFPNIGRTLLTVRNGTTRTPGYAKTYAQKYLFDPDDQRAPAHFHRAKMEDICCLAGGNMLVQLHAAGPDDQRSAMPLVIKVDGIARTLVAGEIVRLRPGQSICIPPRTIHQFWGEAGTCPTVSSEVSSVCDDWSDNAFLCDNALRFPVIIEDAPRAHYLCHEYPRAACALGLSR